VLHRIGSIPCARALSARSSIPYFLYDGVTIPFDDNTFDAVVVAFVLHHAVSANTVVREALRVSNRRIILLEDVVGGGISRWRHEFADSLVNGEFPSFGEGPKHPEEWRALVEGLGGELVDSKYWSSRILGFSFSHVLLVFDHPSNPL